MAECLYTVKNRKTGKILCQGSNQECADYIGCSKRYIEDLVRKQPEYTANTKYSKYKVERLVFGEIKKGGERKKDVICCDCGLLMKDASAKRRRCPECAYKYALEQKKYHMRAVRGKEQTTYICNPIKKYCEGCDYYFGDYDLSKTCNYIFIVGKPRPCPPGKGCTVRIERKGYREKEE